MIRKSDNPKREQEMNVHVSADPSLTFPVTIQSDAHLD